jgi:hypothetical protein
VEQLELLLDAQAEGRALAEVDLDGAGSLGGEATPAAPLQDV